jgi:hypothetical protein
MLLHNWLNTNYQLLNFIGYRFLPTTVCGLDYAFIIISCQGFLSCEFSLPDDSHAFTVLILDRW